MSIQHRVDYQVFVFVKLSDRDIMMEYSIPATDVINSKCSLFLYMVITTSSIHVSILAKRDGYRYTYGSSCNFYKDVFIESFQ